MLPTSATHRCSATIGWRNQASHSSSCSSSSSSSCSSRCRAMRQTFRDLRKLRQHLAGFQLLRIEPSQRPSTWHFLTGQVRNGEVILKPCPGVPQRLLLWRPARGCRSHPWTPLAAVCGSHRALHWGSRLGNLLHPASACLHDGSLRCRRLLQQCPFMGCCRQRQIHTRALRRRDRRSRGGLRIRTNRQKKESSQAQWSFHRQAKMFHLRA
mmetsp:Transcript_69025/g.133205  ORF Transcript_69025/g.133205 Transcript_69025/m.133205 type:complete len:211 (-) Transcript_69025:566-1198(-)